jgi:hypothetical protein
VTRRPASRSLRGRAGVGAVALAAAAALLACGVKAPPRPPEKAGVPGSTDSGRPGAPDGGEAVPPDGGAGRP